MPVGSPDFITFPAPLSLRDTLDVDIDVLVVIRLTTRIVCSLAE